MRGRRRVAAFLVAGIVLLVTPAPTSGVEPVIGTPLPEEPPPIVLPSRAMDAMAFDLDGDGVRELLTVSAAAVAQGLVAVQAWWVDAGGGVESSNQVPVRRSASVDEILSGRGRLGIDRDDMIAVRTDEAAKLVLVERDGREVALVATIGSNPEFPVACCLTIWEVVLEAPGELDLRLVGETQRFADKLVAADMDDDGNDELFVTEGPFMFSDVDAPLEVSLLRWNGTQYQRTALGIPGLSSCCATIQDAGETDGAIGAEVLLYGPLLDPFSANSLVVGLHRLSLREGTPFVEVTLGDDPGAIGSLNSARALTLESGPRIVTSGGFSTLTLWSWPRDGEAQRLFACPSGGQLAAVFGAGSATRIVATAGGPPGSVTVVPGDLGGGSACPSTTVGRDTRAGSVNPIPFGDEAPAAMPFHGVFPGGPPDLPEAYVFSGRMVSPVAGGALAEVEDVSLLAGVEPIGTVGIGEAWVALLTEFSRFEPEPVAVDMLSAHAPATLRLVAAASVLEPEINAGNLEPTFLGVAPDPDHASGFRVGYEAADAEIVGPPGTMVWWSTRGGLGQSSIGLEGTIRIRLLDEAGPDAPEGSGATVEIWAITPAGHAYAGRWRIRVYRQPPSLAISDEGAIVNFSPTLSGRTVPGATVTVNGLAVDVAENGTFEAPMMVGLLPTDVRVVVTDPVGNRTERVVSVVWPVDYRRLPFVPFAVLLTVAAAVVLFLRRPDIGPPTRRTPDDGATFEEIGG